MAIVEALSAWARRALPAAAVATALAVGGCGSSDESSAAGSSTADAAASDIVAEARENAERNFEGTDRPLPRDGPRAVRGKTVWAIACSMTGVGCALPAQAEVEAGRLLGWNMKLVDGKQDPNVYNQQIRAAAAAGADAVILNGIDCAQTKGAIQAAQSAGTIVYGAAALD